MHETFRDYPFYVFLAIAGAVGLVLFLANRGLMRLITKRQQRTLDSVSVDDVGVSRALGVKIERAAWSRLVKVEVITTDTGPLQEDVWWLFHQDDGKGAALPNSAPQTRLAMERLAQMPGYKPEEVIKAMSCATNGKFLVWERPGS